MGGKCESLLRLYAGVHVLEQIDPISMKFKATARISQRVPQSINRAQ